MRPQRIRQMPTPALWIMRTRAFARVERAMTHDVPANALIFGWDWPTAFVLWPRLVRSYEAVKGELRRRFKESGLKEQEFIVTQCLGGEYDASANQHA